MSGIRKIRGRKHNGYSRIAVAQTCWYSIVVESSRLLHHMGFAGSAWMTNSAVYSKLKLILSRKTTESVLRLGVSERRMVSSLQMVPAFSEAEKEGKKLQDRDNRTTKIS